MTLRSGYTQSIKKKMIKNKRKKFTKKFKKFNDYQKKNTHEMGGEITVQ